MYNIEKEFYHHYDRKSAIFAPLIVPMQCKILEKILPLVTAEDSEKSLGLNKLQLALA